MSAASAAPLATIDVGDTSALLYLEREDTPETNFVGVQLNLDGSVTAGHWPDGEDWIPVLTTPGTTLTG